MILEDTLRKLREVEAGKRAMDRETAKDAADALELLLGETRVLRTKIEEAGR